MAENELSGANTAKLVQLLQMSDGPAPLWTSGELAAIFRHQFSAPIEYDLQPLAAGRASTTRLAASAHGLLLKSFADLFNHPNPPLELLKLTKAFAKAHRHQPDSPLPAEISTILYYASIAAAMLRCHQRISTLEPQVLSEGFGWAVGLDWIDAPTRRLFTDALRLLDGGGQP